MTLVTFTDTLACCCYAVASATKFGKRCVNNLESNCTCFYGDDEYDTGNSNFIVRIVLLLLGKYV